MSLSPEVKQALMNTGLKLTFDEPMKNHTSFQTGGAADVFISPKNTNEIKSAIDTLKKLSVPYCIIGNGTNLLVSDNGIRGSVIQICHDMCDIRIENDTIYAGAGALLSSVASKALASSLSGFEKLSGIPGTIGGAISMNAGAYGAQISDVLVSSSYIDSDGNIGVYTSDEHDFGYRKSIYSKSDKIITDAVFKLLPSSYDEIKSQMSLHLKKRRDKQPLNFPSAGSVFKRPEGYFAGELIEKAGLKGYCIGGACVSEKHAGFIINTGDATSDDIMRLIKHIQKVVYEKNNVTLECEIKMLGDF